MDCKEDEIALARIDSGDRTYRVSACSDTGTLATSIREVGLLCPPLVQEAGDGYRVVCGFRRVEACRKLGMETIRARVAGRRARSADLGAAAVADNAACRELGPMEQARALAVLRMGREEGQAAWLMETLLGTGRNPARIRRLEGLLTLPDEVASALEAGAVTEGTALALGELDARDAVVLARMFSDLLPGANKQREMLIHLVEWARRDGIQPRDLLEKTGVRSVLADSELDRNQKINKIRTILWRGRYPGLSGATERFVEDVKRLGLSKDVRWEPPPHFEGEVHTLIIRFRNRTEWKERAAELVRAAEHGAFASLLPE
ncbi:MAG: ParB/RepB/Spo0J family partition protein [Desulfatibacillaceae bacterium]